MHLMVWSSKCGRKKWGVWNSKMRWLSVKEKRMVGQCFRAGMKKTESQSKEINWVDKSQAIEASKLGLFLIMGSLSQASYLDQHLRFFSLHVTFESVMNTTRVQKPNSNKMKLATFCGLFSSDTRETPLVRVSHVRMCDFFMFQLWRELFFISFSFRLELRPNYTGSIAWCPPVMETRVYSFTFILDFFICFQERRTLFFCSA